MSKSPKTIQQNKTDQEEVKIESKKRVPPSCLYNKILQIIYSRVIMKGLQRNTTTCKYYGTAIGITVVN